MRLELRQIDGPSEGGAPLRWYFERGRRTIGRSAECDWQIPDRSRSVSKLHCTLEKDRDGFLLRDDSANGTRVNDVTVQEGETTRLSEGSRLECGAFAFSVKISGEGYSEVEDPGIRASSGGENLTISAILADISPGGQTATGVLGSSLGDDWHIEIGHDAPDKPSSRNVDIGWNGPPDTSAAGTLPEDWNVDFGSRLEHASAPRVAMPATRKQARTADKAAEDTADAIQAADGAEPGPAETGLRPGTTFDYDKWQRLAVFVDRLDELSRSTFALLNVESEESSLEFLVQDPASGVTARIEALLARQTRLHTALEAVFKEASQTLEPRVVEARVDAESKRLLWSADRSYWQAYKQQFEKDGKSLSVRDLMGRIASRALGEGVGESTDQQGNPENAGNRAAGKTGR